MVTAFRKLSLIPLITIDELMGWTAVSANEASSAALLFILKVTMKASKPLSNTTAYVSKKFRKQFVVLKTSKGAVLAEINLSYREE